MPKYLLKVSYTIQGIQGVQGPKGDQGARLHVVPRQIEIRAPIWGRRW